MNLARQAVDEGVIISYKNRIYCNFNFYQWYRDNKYKFTSEELAIMNKLIPNNHTRKVTIIDITNGKIKTFPSISEASRAFKYDFHVVNTEKSATTAISNRLSGKVKNPIYKNQFRFEYADEETS